MKQDYSTEMSHTTKTIIRGQSAGITQVKKQVYHNNEHKTQRNKRR